jgi:hypothetical protein
MRVAIRPLPGYVWVNGEKQTVDTKVDQILFESDHQEPRRVGYVDHRPNAPINLIAPVSESEEDRIREAVAAREIDGGETARLVSVAPPLKEYEDYIENES